MKGLQYFPFERNRYYYGKLLSADVLDAEQSYMNHKRRFVNRFLNGSGVIFGMSVLAADEKTLAVQPGAALDFAGREIVIDQPLMLSLHSLNPESMNGDMTVLYLCVSYYEYPQHKSEASQQYDSVSEHYHFSLVPEVPALTSNMIERFFMQSQVIYESENYTVEHLLPLMVKAGGETVLTVKIKRHKRNAPVKFSYQVRLTGMKYQEMQQFEVSYDSVQQPMLLEEAELHFPLHIQLYAEAEDAAAETVPKSFVSETDQRAEGFSVCRLHAETVMGSLRAKLLQRFRDEGMHQILQETVYQPPICLAAVYLKEVNGMNVIAHIERMPFHQYLYNHADWELLNTLFHEQQEQQLLQIQSGMEIKKLMEQYAVASGITEIAIPIGGRAGQCFFSETISHGLGIGPTALTFGLVSSDTETVYGSSSIFAEKRHDVSAEFAAKLNTEDGSFVIGMRLTEPTSVTSVRVHWTAVHSHSADVQQMHPRLLIKPDVISLNVMESVTFEVQFEQCAKQAVQWSIAEGARGGVITDGGAYTAPNTPGVYQIQVRAVESGLQARAFVSVRDLYHRT